MLNKKGIIVIGIAILLGVGGVYLRTTTMEGYSILAFTLAGVLLLVGAGLMLKSSSPNKQYESTVRDILNTFDSILVKSNTVPTLDGRNVVPVMSMDDLVDAQLEIRKPICYIKQTESCSFVLLDDKEAYVYTEKLNDKVVSPVEIAIQEAKIKNKSKAEMDSEMLREIEKTTVVKLSNQKSYKVSPIRKKQQEELEKTKAMKPVEEKQALKKDDLVVETLDIDEKLGKTEVLDLDEVEIL